MTALLYNVHNMYKIPSRIIILLCLRRLRALLSTQRSLLALLSHFSAPTRRQNHSLHIANRTGTLGPLTRLARKALRRLRGILKNTTPSPKL